MEYEDVEVKLENGIEVTGVLVQVRKTYSFMMQYLLGCLTDRVTAGPELLESLVGSYACCVCGGSSSVTNKVGSLALKIIRYLGTLLAVNIIVLFAMGFVGDDHGLREQLALAGMLGTLALGGLYALTFLLLYVPFLLMLKLNPFLIYLSNWDSSGYPTTNEFVTFFCQGTAVARGARGVRLKLGSGQSVVLPSNLFVGAAAARVEVRVMLYGDRWFNTNVLYAPFTVIPIYSCLFAVYYALYSHNLYPSPLMIEVFLGGLLALTVVVYVVFNLIHCLLVPIGYLISCFCCLNGVRDDAVVRAMKRSVAVSAATVQYSSPLREPLI